MIKSPKSKQINNITDLRNHALGVLRRLQDGEIGLQEAATNAGLTASIISTIKTQMDYAKATEEKPNIPFMAAPMIYAIENKKSASLEHFDDSLENIGEQDF